MESTRGIFIDFDGTICDSLKLLEESFLRFLAVYGVTGSVQEFRELMGPTVPEIVATLKKRHRLEASPQELLQEFEKQIEAIYDRVNPMPGAISFLESVFHQGWKLTIVTSNSERVTRQWIEEQQLASLFSGIVGRESVKEGKPAPDLYLTAIQRSRCAKNLSLAIEDSPRGVKAAIAAGLKTYHLSPENGIAAAEVRWVRSFSDALKDL